MELQQMRQFIAIVEESSFSKAARRLCISQPPLTVAMQKLENELGVQLLLRSNKGVSTTPAGQILFNDSKRILNEIQISIDNLALYGNGVSKRLRFGFESFVTLHQFMAMIVQSFGKSYPNTKVELVSHGVNPHRLIQMVRENEIDLALGIQAEPDNEINSTSIATWNLEAAIPASHPLAQKTSISISELRDEPQLIFGHYGHPAFRQTVYSFCQQEGGFEPQCKQVVDSLPVILSLVEAGEGIAILKGLVKEFPLGEVKLIPFKEKTPQFDTAIVWRKDIESKIVLDLIETTKDLLQKQIKYKIIKYDYTPNRKKMRF